MSNAIELYSRMANPIEAINQIGDFFAKSGMFGCEKSEQGKVLAMVCLAEQKSPVEIVRTYHIIDGKLSKKALAALAEFRAKGGRHKWLKTGYEPVANEDAREAVGDFTFEGQSIRVGFTVADAKRMGFNFKPGSGWSKNPANMLRARVISNALGMLCPEIFAGADEELETDRREAALDLAQVATAPAPSPVQAPPPVIVNVQSEVVTSPEPKPAPTTPAPAAAVPQQAAAPVAAPAQPTESKEALIGKVEEILANAGGTAAQDALVWFVKNKWIPEGGSPLDLSMQRLQKIVNQPAQFLRAIQPTP